MRLRVVTCRVLPEPDPDMEPIVAAMRARDYDVDVVAWDDERVDWDAPVPALLRSPWDYTPRRDEFVAWCERVDRAAMLINPAGVVRENSHKSYLLDLAAHGVATIPTLLLPRGSALAPDDLAARGWRRVVIKPAIAGGSRGARWFTLDEEGAAAAARHAAEWTAQGDVLVQPYIDSVETYGERSIVWIDGALTHSFRKSPRFAGEHEHTTGPHPIAADERDLALAAIAHYADRVLYGRIDMARDIDDRPLVMELELIEPSLYFHFAPPSLDRYIAGLVRRLRAA